MSQIRNKIFLLFSVLCMFCSAQISSEIDKDALELSLQEQLKKAELLTNRGDYYNAKDNLIKALDLATQVNNQKTQGVIHTKIAKLEYLVDEPNKAISSLNQAAQIQHDINDNINLGLTYNIRGVIHSNREEYKTALELFSHWRQSFRTE